MFKELEQRLQGRLVLPEAEDYESTRSIFNAAIEKKPAAIVVCANEKDVSEAVLFATNNDYEISVRGGGHHVSGTALTDQGIMIDLSRMRAVTVDQKERTVTVEGGATLADLDAETQVYGLATPTGTVSETGIAGLALSGGLGYLRAKHGLACDNIVAANLVTADGQIVKVTEQETPDLFWAIRGGGGNFGVVTQFEFQLHPVGPNVLALDVMYDYKDALEIFTKLDHYLQSAPDEISVNLTAMDLPPVPALPEFLHNKPVIIAAGMYDGNPEEGEEVLLPLRKLAQPIMDNTGVMTYVDLQQKLDPMVPQKAKFKGTSLFLKDISEEDMEAIFEEKKNAPGHAMFQIWELHGKVNRIPSDETAFATRDAHYIVLVDVMYEDEQEAECAEWVQHFYDRFAPASLNGAAYLNGIDPDENVIRTTYGGNFNRLLQLKQKYDPDNVFHVNHNIKASESREYSNKSK